MWWLRLSWWGWRRRLWRWTRWGSWSIYPLLCRVDKYVRSCWVSSLLFLGPPILLMLLLPPFEVKCEQNFSELEELLWRKADNEANWEAIVGRVSMNINVCVFGEAFSLRCPSYGNWGAALLAIWYGGWAGFGAAHAAEKGSTTVKLGRTWFPVRDGC